MMMKKIATGWTLARFLYLVFGTFVIIQSILDKQWFMIFPGAYLLSMAVFNFGCAAGACGVRYDKPKVVPETVEKR